VEHLGLASSPAFDEEGTGVGGVWRGDATVRIADAATGNVIRTASIPAGVAALSPDLGRVVVAGDAFAVVDLASGRAMFSRSADSDVDSIDRLVWSPDGRSIAISETGFAIVFDARTGRVRFELPHGEWVHSLAWSRDSSRLASGGSTTAKVWTISHGEPEEVVALSPRLEGGEVASVAFSPDGSRLITTETGTAKVWDVGISGDAEVAHLGTHANWSDVAFLPGGDQLMTVMWERRHPDYMAIWDLGTGRVVRRLGPEGWRYGFVQGQFDLSPDGGAVAAISGGGEAGVWDVASGELLLAFSEEELVSGVDWNPDGTQLLVSSLDGTVRIVDRTGRELRLFGEDDGYRISDARFSPDGRWVAIGAYPDGEVPGLEPHVRIWDLQRNEVTAEIPRVGEGALAFSPQSDRLVTTRADGPAEIWDVDTGTRLTILAGTALIVAEFSPDGASVAAGSLDGTVRLFDAATGGELLVLRSDYEVGYLAFSPDGSMLASADTFDGVRVWALDIDDLLEIARAEVTRPLTDEECRQYLHVEVCPVP
jgi:WD40 repeat protein